MFGRKIVKGEKDLFILAQTLRRFRILRRVFRKKPTADLERLLFRRRQIHLMDELLRLPLNGTRQLAKDVGRFVHPTPLLPDRQMENWPSSENTNRVLALFSEIPPEKWRDILLALSPPPSIRSHSEIPLQLVLYEARRGNEGAVEVLLRTLERFGGLDSMQMQSAISHLILFKPALFIQKLAKYSSALDIKRICNYWGSFELPGFNRDAILRRRIEVLTALRMPRYDKLILRCIEYIKGELAEQERSFGD
jgi:hypothetical protein